MTTGKWAIKREFSITLLLAFRMLIAESMIPSPSASAALGHVSTPDHNKDVPFPDNNCGRDDAMEMPQVLSRKKNTLIVYLHGIGDNVMLTGILREYKRQRPEEEIDLLVLNQACAEVWLGNPHVRRVSVYPGTQPHFWNPVEFYCRGWWRVCAYLRMQGTGKHYARIVFPIIQALPEIIYHVSGTYGRHKVCRLAGEFNLPAKEYPYDLHPDVENKREAEAFSALMPDSGNIAVLHLSSGHRSKCIGIAACPEIIERIRDAGYAPVLVGSETERLYYSPQWEVPAGFGMPLGTLVELLKRATLFVGTDSAVAHLAAFANTPDLVILSPKLRPERYRPISEKGHVHMLRTAHVSPHGILAGLERILVGLPSVSMANTIACRTPGMRGPAFGRPLNSMMQSRPAS